LEITFPANQVTGAKTQSSPKNLAGTSERIKQQPNYNTNNLNDAYK